mmetsp:Transcript_41713/g.131475  ORF Transcript_41713/g.131475 Transcript_41713/m.131475 type:complete len:301 (-) Transcript_41713:2718-3620(-)
MAVVVHFQLALAAHVEVGQHLLHHLRCARPVLGQREVHGSDDAEGGALELAGPLLLLGVCGEVTLEGAGLEDLDELGEEGGLAAAMLARQVRHQHSLQEEALEEPPQRLHLAAVVSKHQRLNVGHDNLLLPRLLRQESVHCHLRARAGEALAKNVPEPREDSHAELLHAHQAHVLAALPGISGRHVLVGSVGVEPRGVVDDVGTGGLVEEALELMVLAHGRLVSLYEVLAHLRRHLGLELRVREEGVVSDADERVVGPLERPAAQLVELTVKAASGLELLHRHSFPDGLHHLAEVTLLQE